MHSTSQDSTGSSQVILNLFNIMLFKRLDHIISNILMRAFEDQCGSILDRTTPQLTRLMTIIKSNYKYRRKVFGACVDVTLVINHFCDRALHASKELFNEIVPTSKSSIRLLNKIATDNKDINNECIVCLSEINKMHALLTYISWRMYYQVVSKKSLLSSLRLCYTNGAII
uniref:Uncharacterized protein n=1 Tax=Solanum lycopersicum TaxID=4081 RepID=A0A3Q7I487_SOLLC